jgi:hypothetical protein
MKIVCVSLVSLLALAGCGGYSSTNAVYAQSGSSNGSLSGTYAFQVLGLAASPAPSYSEVGTVTFNGSGAITGGTSIAYPTGTSGPCVNTGVSGNYSVQASGFGTGTLNITGPSCNPAATLTFVFEIAGGGTTIQIASANGNPAFAGSAVKQ